GVPEVDSGLLLMALVIEGEGIAAHVLEDLGASAERVVAGVERSMGVPPGGGRRMPRSKRRFSFRPPRVKVGETHRLVGIRRPSPRTDTETLRHLLAVQHIAAILRARGLDVERIADQLSKPPDAVVELRRQLSILMAELTAVAAEGDCQQAAEVQARIARLAAQLEKAEEDWLGTLGS
ncbi:MAG TPA: Clp protease N-terminal domain-containing protein, partial [Candidatus Dormibacteraeota bacterium]